MRVVLREDDRSCLGQCRSGTTDDVDFTALDVELDNVREGDGLVGDELVDRRQRDRFVTHKGGHVFGGQVDMQGVIPARAVDLDGGGAPAGRRVPVGAARR